jgi:hypothetical protein
MDFFDLRYAEMASDLATRIEGIQRYDEACDDDELARMWIYSGDARNYAVIGDPAVRIGGDPAPRAAGERDTGDATIHLDPPIAGGDRAAPPGAPAGAAGDARAAGDAEDDIDYLWFRSKDGDQPGGLGQLARDMAKTLHRLVSDALSIEVRTFAGDHECARAATAGSDSARPSAYTHCAIDGDMVICVPMAEDGTVDETLWRIHERAVAQAQKYRHDMLKLALSLLPGTMP